MPIYCFDIVLQGSMNNYFLALLLDTGFLLLLIQQAPIEHEEIKTESQALPSFHQASLVTFCII